MNRVKVLIIAGLTVAVSLIASAQTLYNRFGPSNGIMVGNVASPTTTSATSTDVLSLWSGTCANTTFLRGDGSCQVPPPTTGTGIPGGLNTYVQYNDTGSFSGDAGLTYNVALGVLSTDLLAGAISTGSIVVSGNADLTTIDSIAIADFARLSQANTFVRSVAGANTQTIRNTDAASGSTTRLELLNDVGTVAYHLLTSNANVVPQFTGSPTTVQYLLGTSSAVPLSIGTNGTERIRVAGDGSLINLQATSVQANGVRIPRHAFASLTAGAGCSINASYSNQGVSACNRTGVGTYTATLNAGFTDEPICTFSHTSTGGARMLNGIATTTTNVAFDTFDAAGAAADTSQISLVCVGP